MIPALLAGVVTTLIQNNLPGMAQAVVNKGLDYVEEKTGVKLEPAMSPEAIAALRQAEIAHEEFQIRQANENTASARAMQVAALGQDDLLAKRFVIYLTSFWSAVAALYIAFITFGEIPEANVRFADTVLGFLLGTVVATVLNFWLGSSDGSKRKDDGLIESLKRR